MIKFSKNITKVLVSFGVLVFVFTMVDLTNARPIDWWSNIFIPFLGIGIICLYGGLLDLWTKKQRGL